MQDIHSGLELIVKNRKSAVIFETHTGCIDGIMDFTLQFSEEVFKELLKHIENASNESWTNLNIKEADSLGSDYDEYYDRQLVNNGYLAIRKNILRIERPSLESGELYQFNKRKMELFIYDFRDMAISVE